MAEGQRDDGILTAGGPIRIELLDAALRLCNKDDWTFKLRDVVAALPGQNRKTINAEVNRCCVNAPQHHAKKWPYFWRVRRGVYEIMPEFRPGASDSTLFQEKQVRGAARNAAESRAAGRAAGQSAIHVVITESEGWYVAECLEVAVVTQGRSLDETLANLRSALELHLDEEELARAGLTSSPRLVVSHETFALVS